MSRIVLAHYEFRRKRFWFDTQSGAIMEPSTEKAIGFVQNDPDPARPTMAAYASDGALWFQYGQTRWDLSDEGLVIEGPEPTRGGGRVFKVHGSDSATIEVPLSESEQVNSNSWSFLEQDEAESSVLMLLIARRYRDREWREGVGRAWAKGF